MTSEILVAVCSLFGTLIGALISNRLQLYRIEQLEKKVDRHNNLIDRMYSAENRLCLLEQQEKGNCL